MLYVSVVIMFLIFFTSPFVHAMERATPQKRTHHNRLALPAEKSPDSSSTDRSGSDSSRSHSPHSPHRFFFRSSSQEKINKKSGFRITDPEPSTNPESIIEPTLIEAIIEPTLIDAIKNNDNATVEKLISTFDYNPNEQDRWGNSAAHYAAIRNPDIMHTLFLHPGIRFDIPNGENQTASEILVETQNIQVYQQTILRNKIEQLVQAMIKTNSVFIEPDCSHETIIKNIQAVQAIIKTFVTETENKTLPQYLTNKFIAAMITYNIKKNIRNIKLFFNNPDKINKQDERGNTPLHYATILQNENKVLKLLLNPITNPLIKNNANQTAQQLISTMNNECTDLRTTLFRHTMFAKTIQQQAEELYKIDPNPTIDISNHLIQTYIQIIKEQSQAIMDKQEDNLAPLASISRPQVDDQFICEKIKQEIPRQQQNYEHKLVEQIIHAILKTDPVCLTPEFSDDIIIKKIKTLRKDLEPSHAKSKFKIKILPNYATDTFIIKRLRYYIKHNIDNIKQFLDDTSPNKRCAEYGNTLAHYAALSLNINLMKTVMSNVKTDITIKNNDHQTVQQLCHNIKNSTAKTIARLLHERTIIETRVSQWSSECIIYNPNNSHSLIYEFNKSNPLVTEIMENIKTKRAITEDSSKNIRFATYATDDFLYESLQLHMEKHKPDVGKIILLPPTKETPLTIFDFFEQEKKSDEPKIILQLKDRS